MLPNLSALAQPTEVKRTRAGDELTGPFGDLSLEPPDPNAQLLARMGLDEDERPATLRRQNAYNRGQFYARRNARRRPESHPGRRALREIRQAQSAQRREELKAESQRFMQSAVDALRDAMAVGGLDPADEPEPEPAPAPAPAPAPTPAPKNLKMPVERLLEQPSPDFLADMRTQARLVEQEERRRRSERPVADADRRQLEQQQLDERATLERLALDEEGARARMRLWLSPRTPNTLGDVLPPDDPVWQDYRRLLPLAVAAQAAVRARYRALLPERVRLMEWYELHENDERVRTKVWRVGPWRTGVGPRDGGWSDHDDIHLHNPPEALREWKEAYWKVERRWEVQNYLQPNSARNQLDLLRYLDNNIVNLPMYEFLSGAMQPDDDDDDL